MTHAVVPGPETFQGLGIAENILKSLERNRFSKPTPIQHHCIPPGIEGKDLIGIAQTGTGKTLAFGIPMIQRLARLYASPGASAQKGIGLVLLPTRELALQVDETLQKVGGAIGLRTAILIGGESMGKQHKALARQPHVLIVTPGRLIDHLEQGSVRLEGVKILVLDEADRMLDMGFAPQINKILQRVPKERQTLLFSATMPTDIVKIATHHMRLPLRVEVAPQGTAAEQVEQEIMILSRESKRTMLETLLRQHNGTVLVFSRTKHGAKKICRGLKMDGHGAAELHSNRSLSQRRDALEGFKSGKYRVLVATDIAARGIDVKGIELVVNYDLPDKTEDYVHRIGRTGRAGHSGKAISFATPDEIGEIRRIERLIRKTLNVSRPTGLPMPSPTSSNDSREERGGGYRSAPRGGRRGGPRSFGQGRPSGGGSWGRPRQKRR